MTRLFCVEQRSVFVLKLLILLFSQAFFFYIQLYLHLTVLGKVRICNNMGKCGWMSYMSICIYTFLPILNQRDYHLYENNKWNSCLKQESTPETSYNQLTVCHEVKGLKDSS